jgi:hypothetical protein
MTVLDLIFGRAWRMSDDDIAAAEAVDNGAISGSGAGSVPIVADESVPKPPMRFERILATVEQRLPLSLDVVSGDLRFG